MAITKTYKQSLLDGIKTDTFKVALYSSSATIDENTLVYTSTNEISATGYTAGGATLTGATVDVDGTGYALNFTAYTFTNCNIVARKALIYDVTKSNKAVAVIDFGTDKGVVGSGTFVVDAVVRLP